MAQVNLHPVLCLGCGADLANRAADRRALQGPAAKGVVDAWKSVFESLKEDIDLVESEDRLSVDTLLSGGGCPSR